MGSQGLKFGFPLLSASRFLSDMMRVTFVIIGVALSSAARWSQWWESTAHNRRHQQTEYERRFAWAGQLSKSASTQNIFSAEHRRTDSFNSQNIVPAWQREEDPHQWQRPTKHNLRRQQSQYELQYVWHNLTGVDQAR